MFTEHNHASVLFNRLATSLTTLYPLWLMYWCIDECLGETAEKVWIDIGFTCLYRRFKLKSAV